MAADGRVEIEVNLDAREIDKQIAQVKREIQKLEKSISTTESKCSPLADQMKQYGDELENARKNLQLLKDDQQAINAAMKPGSSPEDYIQASVDKPVVDANVETQQAEVDNLQKKYDSIAARVKTYDIQLSHSNQTLAEQKSLAGDLERQAALTSVSNDKINKTMSQVKSKTAQAAKNMTAMEVAGKGTKSAMSSAASGIQVFGQRLRAVVRSALIFTVITQALAKLRDWIGKVIQTNSEASAAISRLKGALLTLVQPIVEYVIPRLVQFVNLITRLVNTAASLVSRLFGTTFAASSKAAKQLYEQTQATESVGDAMDDTAKKTKKASKSLASFDTLNQLNNSQSDADSSAGTGTGSLGSTGTAPDFAGMIKSQINAIAELFVGIALVALGAVLVFSGVSIPIGLALMVAGALMVYDAVSTNWEYIKNQLQGTLGAIAAGVSAALIAIGLILVCTGAAIPLGLGMIIAGAAGLATVVAANWGIITEKVKEIVNKLIDLAWNGIDWLMTHVDNLREWLAEKIETIGNWFKQHINDISTWFQNAISTIRDWFKERINDISTFFIEKLNAIKKFFQNIINAIKSWWKSNMAKYFTAEYWKGLGNNILTSLSNAWNSVLNKVKEIGNSVKNWWKQNMAKYFTASYWQGLGKNILNSLSNAFNSVLGKVKSVCGSVKNWWKSNMAKFFTLSYWQGLGKNIANGLITMIEKGLNWIINKINSFTRNINSKLDVLSKVGIDINIPSIPKVSIPRLAAGTVIPPNKEFLAVLGDQKQGTNIETPLSTMIQAFKQAFSEMGGVSGGDLTVILELDGQQFGKAVYKSYNKESRRVGASLVNG